MNYQYWIQHFRANRLDRPEPDWEAPFEMPEEKRRLLALSLAEYQLGDGGGECKLVASDAERYRGSAEEARTSSTFGLPRNASTPASSPAR